MKYSGGGEILKLGLWGSNWPGISEVWVHPWTLLKVGPPSPSPPLYLAALTTLAALTALPALAALTDLTALDAQWLSPNSKHLSPLTDLTALGRLVGSLSFKTPRAPNSPDSPGRADGPPHNSKHSPRLSGPWEGWQLHPHSKHPSPLAALTGPGRTGGLPLHPKHPKLLPALTALTWLEVSLSIQNTPHVWQPWILLQKMWKTCVIFYQIFTGKK